MTANSRENFLRKPSNDTDTLNNFFVIQLHLNVTYE